MCKVIQAILHSTDTEALISTDSAHAVELLHNRKFDSVFLDVNMPPPDGIELTRLIRASGPNQRTPVIIVGGEEDPSVVRLSLHEESDQHFLIDNFTAEKTMKRTCFRSPRFSGPIRWGVSK